MIRFLIAALAFTVASPALAQASFPTSSSVAPRAAGVVPLQCNSGVTACTPITAANPPPVAGNAASGATDSGNPVKIGGVYNTTLPTLTNGQRGDAQMSSKGVLYTTLMSLGGGAAISNTTPADALSNGQVTLTVSDMGQVFNGTTWDRLRGDTNSIAVAKGLTATRWRYTSGTSPILSNTTTAVTIKTAAGSGVKNAIDSCQLTTTAFGASVPLAIRDGAAGTVIWALTVPTAGFLQPVTIVFEQPLVGTANTLLEVVTTTANTSGTVTLNCQGHTEL